MRSYLAAPLGRRVLDDAVDELAYVRAAVLGAGAVALQAPLRVPGDRFLPVLGVGVAEPGQLRPPGPLAASVPGSPGWQIFLSVHVTCDFAAA